MNAAVAATLDAVDAANIGPHTCVDAAERRRLARRRDGGGGGAGAAAAARRLATTDAVSISFEILVQVTGEEREREPVQPSRESRCLRRNPRRVRR